MYGILRLLLVAALTAAQPLRDSALRAAITAEPGDIARYVALADFYEQRGAIHQADAVLAEALGVDPSSRTLHERRVRLYERPFNPMRVGVLAIDWVGVDGTNPVPVLLAAGHRLRRASALRGDGTSAALDEIDTGLRDLESAVPANPDHPGLAAVRVTLLQAKATLTPDREDAASVVEAATRAQHSVDDLWKRPESGAAPLGAFATLVAAMLRPVPFGPLGAVRAGSVVPRPRALTHPPLRLGRSRPGMRLRTAPVELVIDHEGRVAQVFVVDSVEGYDQSVVETLRRWRFEPTTLDGKPVWVILTMGVPAP